jgi:hypothetical protein
MTLHVTTRVLPGNRIEVNTAGIPEGQDVEVTITPLAKNGESSSQNVLDFIDSLPPGPRSAASWTDLERQIQEERASWDR